MKWICNSSSWIGVWFSARCYTWYTALACYLLPYKGEIRPSNIADSNRNQKYVLSPVQIYSPSHKCLPFLVECPLVFEPLPISLYTRDLLAVEIGDGVRH